MPRFTQTLFVDRGYHRRGPPAFFEKSIDLSLLVNLKDAMARRYMREG